MTRKYWSKEEITKVFELREQGKTYKEIAEFFNVSRGAVESVASRGLKKKFIFFHFTTEHDNFLK